MGSTLLRFEDGKISIGGRELLVSSARLSMQTSLSKERVYGDSDSSLRGSTVNFLGHRALSPVKGNLSISFYISSESMHTNNIEKFAELAQLAMIDRDQKKISELPINDNIVGRYAFDNMYIKSFSFEMKPFGLILASATYDIYGTIRSTVDSFFVNPETDFAHALSSFGSIKINGNSVTNYLNEDFEVLSFRYNIMVSRRINLRIRENESTAISENAGGAIPSRVTVESIEAEAEITASTMIDNLNHGGDQQRVFKQNQESEDSFFELFMYTLKGKKISRFTCKGKIVSQDLSISDGSNAVSNIKLHQVIK